MFTIIPEALARGMFYSSWFANATTRLYRNPGHLMYRRLAQVTHEYIHHPRNYFRDTGIVTGGQYGSGQGCQPYLIPKCEHHTDATKYPKCGDILPTPECKHKCEVGKITSHT